MSNIITVIAYGQSHIGVELQGREHACQDAAGFAWGKVVQVYVGQPRLSPTVLLPHASRNVQLPPPPPPALSRPPPQVYEFPEPEGNLWDFNAHVGYIRWRINMIMFKGEGGEGRSRKFGITMTTWKQSIHMIMSKGGVVTAHGASHDTDGADNTQLHVCAYALLHRCSSSPIVSSTTCNNTSSLLPLCLSTPRLHH